MQISESHQIPHQRLRPFFGYWNRQRGTRRWPRRQEITLDVLRGAAANVAFCRIERPYRGLHSLRFVNVGTAIEQGTGHHITGMTVGELLRGFGSSPEFTRCFSEYGVAAVEGTCSYNEGMFPWPHHNWLGYRRLVMPLGDSDEADALFVVIDLNAEGLELAVPNTLSAFEVADPATAQPWPRPALRARH